jgi:hypothetical protein
VCAGTGLDIDGGDTEWTVSANVCRTSASNVACQKAGGAVCITNMTSGELTVGGRLEGKGPVPRFELIDASNAQMGVTLTFDNSPDPDEDTITSVLQLRCDRRFLTANLSAVRWSPRRRQLLMVLDAVDACPTYVPPPPSHMPVWGIVLIAIASAVAAYVLVGCMYMRCVRGTPLGWASCPNHEFWCKGPRVVMRATSRAFSFVLNGCKSVSQQNAHVEGHWLFSRSKPVSVVIPAKFVLMGVRVLVLLCCASTFLQEPDVYTEL